MSPPVRPARPAVRRGAAVAVLLAACSTDPTAPAGGAPPAADTLPALRREFRGVWVATVANIDWPSRAGLTAAQQQAELTTLLDRAAAARLNAVVFHVRPAADALYASALEPWSRSLTGTQGAGPGYDPLAFAVREAHRRGMELHAWFNPFRAGNAGDTLRLAATHVWNARRDLARRYGSQLWMDPGLPEVHERTVRVIRDVVRRYDVDAVHLDDYFYPYLERDAQSRIIDFPDSLAYARENPRGLSRADWRRDNVNRFVERLYREVHEERPWVRVGISPFGIWRPGSAGGAPGTAGLDAFAEIYADSRLWLSRGWVDYLAPQLYWRIDAAQQSYPTLLGWWAQQNTQRRHLWPGNAAYRVYEAGSLFTPAELVSQVTATRAAGATGNVFYNATATLARNGGEVAAALAGSVYREPAVPPATPWLDATPPARPTIHVAESAGQGGERVYTVTPGAADADVRWWVVRWRGGGVWSQRVVRGTEPAVAVSSPAPVDVIALHAADRVWNAGEPAVWRPTAAVAAAAAVR